MMGYENNSEMTGKLLDGNRKLDVGGDTYNHRCGAKRVVKRIAKTLALPFAAGMLLCGVALSQQPANDMQTPPVTGIVADHVGLSVENIPVEAEWYERVLGFKVSEKVHTDPRISSWRMLIPGFRLDLIKYDGSKHPAPVDPVFLQQGWIHLVFRVGDLAKTVTELHALQVKMDVVNDSKGNPIQIILHDPEGNEVRIRPS